MSSIFNLFLNNFVARFFKGIYRKRPVKLKYFTTWDTEPVLSTLEKFPSMTDLNASEIVEKTSRLLALVT